MRSSTAGTVLLRVVVSLCAVFAGCHGCKGCAPGDPPLATLSELRSDKARRDYGGRKEQWEPAKLGSQFRLGDGLRTDAPSSAVLDLADGATLLVRSGTLIRFLIDGTRDGERGIDVLTGEALLNTGSRAMRLRTHVGLAIVAPDSQMVLTRQGKGLRFHLDVGAAQFRDPQGRDVTMAPGESVSLDVGMATMHAVQEIVPPPVPSADAIVARVQHDGVRAKERGAHAFHGLERGEHVLAAGTSLRLPAGTEVQLTRGEDHAQLHGAGEYVIGDGEVWVEAVRGDMELSARAKDMEIVVPGGSIMVRAANGGSTARVRVGEDEGVLEVQSGGLTFKDSEGSRELGNGSDYHWSYTRAAGSDTDSESGPNYANIQVRAGESFVVHAPTVPIALGFDFAGKCRGEGQVELTQGKQRSRGAGHANLLLPAGARGYAVRCIDARGAVGKVVARGNVHVLRDAGTRDLPPVAPTSSVEADGRSYTIYYQNQLPNVRLRWPNPPASASYKLDLDGNVVTVPTPEHLFASGNLRDGVHRMTFEAAGRKSRTASVDVRFDNTAPTASLTTPAEGGFSPGDTVSIEGVALPAWKVSLQGGTIQKVGDDRFHGEIVTSAEHPDIAVRLAHPRLGTHYYLRRAAGSR